MYREKRKNDFVRHFSFTVLRSLMKWVALSFLSLIVILGDIAFVNEQFKPVIIEGNLAEFTLSRNSSFELSGQGLLKGISSCEYFRLRRATDNDIREPEDLSIDESMREISECGDDQYYWRLDESKITDGKWELVEGRNIRISLQSEYGIVVNLGKRNAFFGFIVGVLVLVCYGAVLVTLVWRDK